MTPATTYTPSLHDALPIFVLFAECVSERRGLAVDVLARSVERGRVVRAGGLECIQHVVHAQLEVLGELVHRRRAPSLARERLLGLLDLQRLLLRSARNVHRPAEIAEV